MKEIRSVAIAFCMAVKPSWKENNYWGIPLHLIGDMTVNIQCKGGGGMAQVALHRFDVVPAFYRCHGIRVPLLYSMGNVVFSYGAERFISSCQEIGMDGIIMPDLPFEEKGEFAPICRAHGVDLISLAAPAPAGRIAMIAREAEGFLYVVSGLGVTGTRSEITTDLASIAKVVRENTSIPCAVGSGISTPEQAKRIDALREVSL